MFVATLLLVVVAQQPTPPAPPPPEAEVKAAEPRPVPPYSDQEAKAAVAAFTKAAKGEKAMAARVQALDELGRGTHKLLIKPLAAIVTTDKLLVVRKRAAELLALQPAADVTPVLQRLLQDPGLKHRPTVLAEVVRGLARTGYERKHWSGLEDLFEADFAAENVPLQEAILDLVTQHQERLATNLLLRHIDEPAPENVDDPSNPPQEYWEARWKAWKAWRGKVKDALFALTGQRFSTASEAEAWLRKNRK